MDGGPKYPSRHGRCGYIDGAIVSSLILAGPTLESSTRGGPVVVSSSATMTEMGPANRRLHRRRRRAYPASTYWTGPPGGFGDRRAAEVVTHLRAT